MLTRFRQLFSNFISFTILLLVVGALIFTVSHYSDGTSVSRENVNRTEVDTAQQPVEFITPTLSDNSKEMISGQFSSPVPTPTPAYPPRPVPTPIVFSEEFFVSDTKVVDNGPYQTMLWSPDGSKVLITKEFTRYKFAEKDGEISDTGIGDLWVMDWKTGKELKLADNVGRYAWSPNSKQVVYIAPTKTEGIAGAVFVIDVAEGKLQQIADADFLGSDYDPQWLPDNNIVFVRNGQLWVVNIDSEGKTEEKELAQFKLYSGAARDAGQEIEKDIPGTMYGYKYSPDGKRMAYIMPNVDEWAIARQLWIADANGSNAKLITKQFEGYYEWSPDGNQLFFDTYHELNESRLDQHLPGTQFLWVLQVDKGESRLLYKSIDWHWIVFPTWSPKGDTILFLDSGPTETGEGYEQYLWMANITKGYSERIQGDYQTEQWSSLVGWSSDTNSIFMTQEIKPTVYQTTQFILQSK